MKLLAFFLTFVLASSKNYERKDVREKEAKQGLYDLGWHMVKSSPDGNVVLSPFCIAGVLHMLAAGSAGETREEILINGLGLQFAKYMRDDAFIYPWVVEAYGKFQKDLVGETKVGGKVQYQASIFNGLYTQKTDSKVRSDVKAREVLPAYRWVLRRQYIKDLGNMKQMDFANSPAAATQEINDVVSRETHGKIKRIISTLPTETLAVLLSAIYFESKWEGSKPSSDPVFQNVSPGDAFSNKNYCFRKNPTDNGCLKPKSWIKSSKTDQPIYVYLDDASQVNVIQLELKSNSDDQKIYLTMYQPTNGLTGMNTLKQWDTATFGGLTDAAIDYWVDKSEEELKGVVHMPSFDISFSDKINQYLITKGVKKAFKGGEADLSHMLPNKRNQAFVSYIQHAATFSLNNEGVVASAATAAVIINRSLLSPMTTDHYLNSPFYFILSTGPEMSHSNDRIPLFMGKLVNPRP